MLTIEKIPAVNLESISERIKGMSFTDASAANTELLEFVNEIFDSYELVISLNDEEVNQFDSDSAQKILKFIQELEVPLNQLADELADISFESKNLNRLEYCIAEMVDEVPDIKKRLHRKLNAG